MRKSNKIKVIVKPPKKIAHFEWIENDLKSFQDIVGGYIEAVTLSPDLVIICNEEGRLMGLEENCRLYHPDNYRVTDDSFVGTIVAASVKKDEFSDVKIGLARFMSMVV